MALPIERVALANDLCLVLVLQIFSDVLTVERLDWEVAHSRISQLDRVYAIDHCVLVKTVDEVILNFAVAMVRAHEQAVARHEAAGDQRMEESVNGLGTVSTEQLAHVDVFNGLSLLVEHSDVVDTIVLICNGELGCVISLHDLVHAHVRARDLE